MHRNLAFRLFSFLSLGVFLHAGVLFAQSGNSGTINGVVKDPSGAVVTGATVSIHNPVSGYDRTTTTDSTGSFSFSNIPLNPYHLSVEATGFGAYAQDVEVRSSVPVAVNVALTVAGSSSTVTVEGGGDLIENDSTFHTDVDRALFDKLPLESQSSSVSSLVTLSTPGVAADSNGLFHGLGDHAENSFSVDGQPITDQQSKVFSNQITARFDPVARGDCRRTAGRIRGQDEPCDQRDHALGPGRNDAARKRVRLVWFVRIGDGRLRPRLRRRKVGKLHFGKRSEQRPIPRSAGIHGDARQRQSRKMCSIAWIISSPPRTPST